MSEDNEHQQVAIALMNESEQPTTEEKKKNSKTRTPRTNYCTEEYLVKYGVPVIIVLLLILFIILIIFGVRKYNKNCAPTKGVSCRGLHWFFT